MKDEETFWSKLWLQLVDDDIFQHEWFQTIIQCIYKKSKVIEEEATCLKRKISLSESGKN